MHPHPLRCLIVLLALTTSAACKKDGGATGWSGRALGYLPADSSVVISADLDDVRSSKLFKSYEARVREKMPQRVTLGMKELEAVCEMDPIEVLDRVLIGMSAKPGSKRQIVMVASGDFDRARVEGCLSALATKYGKEMRITEEAKVVTYSYGSGEDLNAYWPDPKTLVVSPSRAPLEAVAGGASVEDNDVVMAMIKKVDGGASMWAAGELTQAMVAYRREHIAVPRGSYASLEVGSGIEVTAGIAYDEEKDAAKLASMAAMLPALAAQAGPFAELIERIDVEQDEKQVVAKLTLTAEHVELLLVFAKVL